MAILVVGETVGEGEWQGVVRVQDVRATEKDRVKIAESFRPGDVVRAIVVCLIFFSYLFFRFPIFVFIFLLSCGFPASAVVSLAPFRAPFPQPISPNPLSNSFSEHTSLALFLTTSPDLPR